MTDAGGTTAPQLRAALSGSSILPSDTAVRYASFLGMVFATTVEIYTRLWLDRASHAGAYQACWANWMKLGPVGWLSGSAQHVFGQSLGCAKPYAPGALSYALAGVAAVGTFAVVGYLALPWWRIKRRTLQPLDRVRSTDLHAHLERLVDQMGLAARPTFWLAPEGSAQGVAFGRQGRCHIQLNAGLVKKYRTDPDAVTAVVLHELAHVQNRDIRYTYLAVTTWWAFVVVALVPYLLIGVLPLVADVYPPWWPGELRASSINGHVLMSVLVLTGLAYLTYTAILRVRETHADAAVAAAGGEALRRVLEHAPATNQAAPRWRRRHQRLPPGWEVLRTHPSATRRLTLLDRPAALYSISAPEMIGAGIAIAVVQANLITLTSALATWLPAADSADSADSSASPLLLPTARLAAVLLVNGVSFGLIAGLACVTTWRARLGTYPALSPPPALGTWLWPAAALSAGLLVGEPLSLYYGRSGELGVFDGVGGAGRSGVAAVLVSVGALLLIVAALFAWMSECAGVWIPVIRRSLRRVGVVASLVGLLAFGPIYSSWSTFHDTVLLTKFISYGGLPSPRVGQWTPPGLSLAQAMYPPTIILSMLPGVAVVLALPCLFLIAGALRRPPQAAPGWLRAAGPAAAGVALPAPPRTSLGAAMLAGLAGGLLCLATYVGLAMLVWAHIRGVSEPGIKGAAWSYLFLATVVLVVVFSALTAAVVAARTRHVGATYAVLAAFVATSVFAIAAPLVSVAGVCGPVDVLADAGCRSAAASTAPAVYGLVVHVGVPHAVVAACLAATAGTGLARLARLLRPAAERTKSKKNKSESTRADDDQPSRRKRAVLLALTAAVAANLAVGSYVGYLQLLAAA